MKLCFRMFYFPCIFGIFKKREKSMHKQHAKTDRRFANALTRDINSETGNRFNSKLYLMYCILIYYTSMYTFGYIKYCKQWMFSKLIKMGKMYPSKIDYFEIINRLTPTYVPYRCTGYGIHTIHMWSLKKIEIDLTCTSHQTSCQWRETLLILRWLSMQFRKNTQNHIIC